MMRQDGLASVSTGELRRLLSAADPPWLVYAPDRATFADGHIPGSLAAPGPAVLTALAVQGAVVLYGESDRAAGAPRLAAELLGAGGRDVRWYAGGLEAWRDAGLPVDASGGAGTGPGGAGTPGRQL